MHYFVFLTQICNLECKYCGGTIENNTTPKEIDYELDDLIRFLKKDNDRERVICFYGGEPCLRPDIMEKMIDKLPAEKFILHTNGTKIDRLSTHCLENLDTILVSIDGNRDLNDLNRGQGNHDTVLEKTALIRKKGFSGDLIARMTVTEKTNIEKEVKYLLEMEEPVNFNHIHWQLDVFWTEDNHWEDLKEWVEKKYNPGISRLVEYWISNIEKYKRVPGIVPFQGIIKTILSGKSTTLPCGAGIDFFAVNTSGLITACPICPEWEMFQLGNINETQPARLYRSLLVGDPCLECEVYGICGGRCLFANKTNLWGKDEFDLVCQTVKHLVNELKKAVPRLMKLINRGDIGLDDFQYPEFNNSCEIIP